MYITKSIQGPIMTYFSSPILLSFILFSLISCEQKTETVNTPPESTIKVAQLSKGDEEGLEALRVAFVERNPGYDLHYFPETQKLSATSHNRVVFVQTGGGTAAIEGGTASKFSVGDIFMLKPGEALSTDSSLSMLVFTVPKAAPANIPAFVRPDWDPNITDTPGGCATENNAYRRILLTWLDKVGPYQYHALNAHRVRIMDSFTHYHPKEGGFDEFYLVQMAKPQARLITSAQVELIENPAAVKTEQTKELLQSTSLNVGDLVYLPRGTIHRGVGGVLAQVITVPGFVPKSEIGVDHHLKKINEALELEGEAKLPYNEAASVDAVVK